MKKRKKKKKRNPNLKSKDQVSVIQYVEIFFDLREKIIDFSKQILQRLPIALGQVKTVNTSENLLNEIRQIIYSFYQVKEVTKKVYNNIMNLIMI